MVVLALSLVTGCDEEELESWDAGEEPPARQDGGKGSWPDDPEEDDAGWPDDAAIAADAGAPSDAGNGGAQHDAGAAPVADASVPEPQADASAPEQPAPTETARTEVPDALVGAWHDGALSFETWENYREGQWAGRNAVPTREAMVFHKNGDAKFYRFEALFPFYEELIDCEGTVAFGEDDTFTFYPVRGRKRFHDFQHSERNADRALTPEELVAPKLAGKRSYAYDPGNPSTLRIKVPTSAPYNWYRKE